MVFIYPHLPPVSFPIRLLQQRRMFLPGCRSVCSPQPLHAAGQTHRQNVPHSGLHVTSIIRRQTCSDRERDGLCRDWKWSRVTKKVNMLVFSAPYKEIRALKKNNEYGTTSHLRRASQRGVRLILKRQNDTTLMSSGQSQRITQTSLQSHLCLLT